MAVARAVTFDGVTNDRLEELRRRLQEGEAPPDFPATELVVLHDPAADSALVIVFFENEDDYRRGDEILDAMPAGDTPGRRTSVTRYDVALRMTP